MVKIKLAALPLKLYTKIKMCSDKLSKESNTYLTLGLYKSMQEVT